MNENPMIQPRFKADIVMAPRNGGDTTTHEIRGITPQEIVDQYENIKALEAENGFDVYLPSEVFQAALKEPLDEKR